MTPAIQVVERANIPHRVHTYIHAANVDSYGEEAAEKLGIAMERVFKTLIVTPAPKQFAVALVPVSTSLVLKRAAKALGTKKIDMAAPQDAERVTGYLLGGVSPLGQKRQLPTLIDQSAQAFKTIYISAGRRGVEIELAPADLADLTKATYADLC